MNTATEPRTLWVDTDHYALYREGPSLVVQAPGRAPKRIPLARVARAVIEGTGHSADMLDACLSLAAAGAVVHFPHSATGPSLRLQPEHAPTNMHADELAAAIADRSGLGPFEWWADCQRRHACSLVFRHGPPGDFAAARARLYRYIERIGPAGHAPDETDWLNNRLREWLGAELHRCGWQPVVHALAARGARIEPVLRDCLFLHLLWRFASWRRQQPADLPRRELVRFFEWQSLRRMPDQLQRHLQALAWAYHTSGPGRQMQRESSDG